MLRRGGDESEPEALHEAVLGEQHEMGQECEVRTGVDASRSIALSQSLPAIFEHVVPHQNDGTSKQTLVCLLQKKQMMWLSLLPNSAVPVDDGATETYADLSEA